MKEKISSLILATKTGGEKYDLKVEKIENNGGVFHLPDQAYLTIKATGNVHIVPRGIVYLKDSGGKVIKRGVINAESGYVLPSTDRIFQVQLQTISQPKFWDHSYRLQVDYRYDGIDRYTSKSLALQRINPWWLVIMGGIGGLLWRAWHNPSMIKKLLRR